MSEKLITNKSEELIQVRDMLIEFGTGRKKNKAVKGVTFDVHRGETFGLVGESGSGKTTVARAVMGMQKISDGAVYFENQIARGKKPNLYKLSKALDHNLNILIDNQVATTLKINDYISEYKRVYYKYTESKYYDLKTGQTRDYKDNVDRIIQEGTNLKDSKIVTSDKENNLKQITILVKDSLKRLVKIVRILQKTIKFSDHLSNYINLDPSVDAAITNYLKTSAEKILVIKEFENQIYFALNEIRSIRRSVLQGNYNSIQKFFDDIGYRIKVIVAKHKEISNYVPSIQKDFQFVEALTSTEKKRSLYIKKFLKVIDEIKEMVEPDNEILDEYQKISDLLNLKNINVAIDESQIFVKPKRKRKKCLKQEMQMIFQDPASSLNDRMSVEEIIGEGLSNFPELYWNDKTIAEYAKWAGLDKSQISKIKPKEVKRFLILEQIKSVGLLPEHLSRYPHEFSGGQRQRIGIARSLIMRPKFIVADEPISALDVSIRAQVLNLLNKFKKEYDLTYIFIAHDLSVVRHIADRIAVIYRGDIVELADAEELFQNPLHPYTKSLLSAIPLADPEQERNKVHLVYDSEKEHSDYLSDFPVWQEVIPGHYVYANQREAEIYRQQKITKPKRKTVIKEKKTKTTKAKTSTAKKVVKPKKKKTQTISTSRQKNLGNKIIKHQRTTKVKKEHDWIGVPVKKPKPVTYIEEPSISISQHKIPEYQNTKTQKGKK